MEIDVKEASRRLGVNDSRVRQLLRAGELRGRRVGNAWVVQADDVIRRQRGGGRPGRPLSPKRAWAALDLLDGGRASWLSYSARSHVRRYLADLVNPGPDEWRAVLRARSRVLDVVAHPAAIERLRRSGQVCEAGLRAAVSGFDIVAVFESAPEFYVAADRWPELSRALALRDGPHPNLKVRIPNEVWPFVHAGRPREQQVGAAAIAADLLESAEPRAVAAGALRLDELLADWSRDRSSG